MRTIGNITFGKLYLLKQVIDLKERIITYYFYGQPTPVQQNNIIVKEYAGSYYINRVCENYWDLQVINEINSLSKNKRIISFSGMFERVKIEKKIKSLSISHEVKDNKYIFNPSPKELQVLINTPNITRSIEYLELEKPYDYLNSILWAIVILVFIFIILLIFRKEELPILFSLILT